MFFKRINENTINCIITPEDLSEQGIQLEDLFERKEEALAYLRRVILQAAREENFTLKGENASMRISVLPDHSVSLTLSDGVPASSSGEGRTVQDVIDEIRSRVESASGQDNASDRTSSAAPASQKTSGSRSAKTDLSRQNVQDGHSSKNRVDEYGYVFYSMSDVINCCRNIGDIDCFTSSLYADKEAGEYYLLLQRKGTDTDAIFERVVLSLNEFGDPIDDGPEYLASIREHVKCICKDDAVRQLAGL